MLLIQNSDWTSAEITTTISSMTIPRCSFYAERLDPSRSMARFYALEVVEDLFGAVWLERRWGRIGSTGQKKIELLNGQTDLLKRMDALARRKQMRGYLPK
jgi:predicted DNA-binding WGR domain protein